MKESKYSSEVLSYSAVAEPERTGRLIQRRLSFVLGEIVSDNPTYDQSVSMVLRALSNFASVGVDKSSSGMKLVNPRMSVEAYTLRNALRDDRLWVSQTINEHPFPLRRLWDSWLERSIGLSERNIWVDLVSNPMVTVTRSEDKTLKRVDNSSRLYGAERYDKAGIVVMSVDRSRDMKVIPFNE